MAGPPSRRSVPFGGRIGRTPAESVSWWPAPLRPPVGAPNIVVVLVDDMGFSDIGPFGSEIATPTLDRLAERGLRLTNYHTTPVCSPARAALMTGINPHRVGYASVANYDPGFPGYTMELPDDVPTLAECLRDAGYATFAVGKWHLTRDASMQDAASRRSWPIQKGFERYYGVLEGLTNLHHPHRLVRDNSPVEVDRYPDGYYLTDDITDEAIGMIKALRAGDSDKPFFLYVAHSAVHGPLMAKPEDMARYRGRYDQGWDRVREERFSRQLAAGLFPAGTVLAPRNFEPGWDVGPWDELPADERKLFARYQEVYAAMVDNVDQNLGRLLGTIAALGELDNTVVVFTSDNGGTAEGGERGTRSYFKQFVDYPDGVPVWPGRDVPRDLELIGGPRALVQYPRGWGMASNTPFRLYKANTHAGGIRVPFLVSWPARLPGAGGIRTQYQYVTDLLPTLLAAAGIDRPSEGARRPARSLDGSSFVANLHDPGRPSDHTEQYVEFGGNRAFYRDGWKLVSLHTPGAPYDDGEWQLYDIRSDPTERIDRAAEHPEIVTELAAGWEEAAWVNDVFPLDDGTGYLTVIRRPDEDALRRPVVLLAGTPTLERYRSAKLTTFRSFRVEVSIDHGPADEGVLVAHGDQGGGYVLYVENGRLGFGYNEYGNLLEVDAGVLDEGSRLVELDATAVEGLAWDFQVLVDGAVRGRLDGAAMLIGEAPFEGINVGTDRRSPVSWPLYERHGPFPYQATLHRVIYRPGAPAPYDPETLVGPLRRAASAFE
ncbi:MAG: arylsulfatase [Streptosporangiaceae bacterium]